MYQFLLVFLLFIGNDSWGAPKEALIDWVDEAAPQTPGSKRGGAAAVSPVPEEELIQPTPGQLVTLRQLDVIQREAFEKAFNSKVIEGWLLEERQWERFQDPNIPFEDQGKKNFCKRLISKMLPLVRNLPYEHPQKKLFHAVSDLIIEEHAAHPERLKKLSIEKFSEISGVQTVMISDKQGGRQIGCRATVVLDDGTTMLWHVKTHSGGRLANTTLTQAPEVLNIRELFVYRLLERLNLGSHSLFWGRDEKDFYIATKDAGHGGVFHTFSREVEDEERQTLWGNLDLLPETLDEEFNHQSFEANLNKNAQDYLCWMTTADLLSRMLCLGDVLTNSDNFGFFRGSDQKPRLKIIDFGIFSRFLESGGAGSYLWQGFLIGNTDYHYEATHKTLRYAVRDRVRGVRFLTAQDIFKAGGILHNADAHIGAVVQELGEFIRIFLEENQKLSIEEKGLLKRRFEGDLKSYRHFILSNCRFFQEKLEQSLTEEDRIYTGTMDEDEE